MHDDIRRSIKADDATSTNPLLLLHRYMRGRYWYAVPLALLAAAPGAYFGYTAFDPTYESVGRVQIAPSVSLLLDESSRPDVMPMYDNFINGEAMLAQSQRVASRALEINDQRLVRQGWPDGMRGTRLLSASLTAAAQRKTNFIVVGVSHVDPGLAKEAATAVIHAYMDLYGSRGAIAVARDRDDLERLQATYNDDLKIVRREIQDLLEGEGFASDDLDVMQSQFVAKVTDLELRLATVDMEIAIVNARSSNAPGSLVVSDQYLEAMFPEFAFLVDQKRGLDLELSSMIGISEKHHSKRQLLNRIAALEEQLSDLKMLLVEEVKSQPMMPDANIADLEKRRGIIENQLLASRSELARVNEANAVLRGLTERESELKLNLRRVKDDLQGIEINIERLEERTFVRDWPEMPLEPSSDKRLPMAAAGAMAGFGSMIAIIAGLGFIDRRIRYIDQVEESNLATPLLGVIPILHSRKDDRETAAECIHHLRNMIESQLDRIKPNLARRLHGLMPCEHCGCDVQGLSIRDDCPNCHRPVSDTIISAIGQSERSSVQGRSLVVTSSGAGDGKTSVTVALGMSLAAAGRRTIVVDADLVGRGLSHSLGLESAPGLCELTAVSGLNGEVHKTAVTNLWALPAGKDRSKKPENMGRELVKSLFDDLESQFDVVLIDTGPLLGSLEASLVSSRADSVLLVVNKGQDSTHVQRTLRQIAAFGGHCLGIVYNRATSIDIARSMSTVSASMIERSTPDKGQSKRPLIAAMDADRSIAE